MAVFFDISNINEKNLSEEHVKDWLHKANMNKLNVFYDRNKIITILCKTLLEEWKKSEKIS